MFHPGPFHVSSPLRPSLRWTDTFENRSFLHQRADYLAAFDHRHRATRTVLDVQILGQAEDMEQRSHEIDRPDRCGPGYFGARVGFADDLAHFQTTARQGKSTQRTPVLAAAVLV